MSRPVRQFLRFPPDQGAVAWLDPEVHEDRQAFKPMIAALVTDEALTGCGLIALGQDWFVIDAELTIRVGNLVPLKARIRWIRELGEGVVKLGVGFLE